MENSHIHFQTNGFLYFFLRGLRVLTFKRGVILHNPRALIARLRAQQAINQSLLFRTNEHKYDEPHHRLQRPTH